MGGCMSHMKREMNPLPPVNRHNGQCLNPQRPEAHIPSSRSQQEVRKTSTTHSNGNCQPLRRFETPSGIPGLTYDQAGRPVWREEVAEAAKAKVEHRENTGRRW